MKVERCKYCGRPMDMEVENAEEKLGFAISLQHGKEIYYAIRRREFKSIELCNFHYTLLRVYRERKKPELGDSNYNSGHSIDVNGNCNMGCC